MSPSESLRKDPSQKASEELARWLSSCKSLREMSGVEKKKIDDLLDKGASLWGAVQSEAGTRGALARLVELGEVGRAIDWIKKQPNGAAAERQEEAREALKQMAGKGSAEGVREMLRIGSPIGAGGTMRTSPLMWAASRENMGALMELIRAGANVDEIDERGNSALHRAARGGWSEGIQALMRAGADTGVQNQSRETPLMWAAKSMLVDRETAMELATGKAIGKLNDQGQSAALIALRAGHKEVALALAEKGDPLRAEGFDAALVALLHPVGLSEKQWVELLDRRGPLEPEGLEELELIWKRSSEMDEHAWSPLIDWIEKSLGSAQALRVWKSVSARKDPSQALGEIQRAEWLERLARLEAKELRAIQAREPKGGKAAMRGAL